MKLNSKMRMCSLVVGLALGGGGAYAQDGYRITPNQESLVKPGMSKSEVQQVIGRPARDASYGVTPGSTWLYTVTGAVFDGISSNGVTVYEVDFGSDGRVIAARERIVNNADHGGSWGY